MVLRTKLLTTVLDMFRKVNKQKKEIKPKSIKACSLPRDQNKNISQNSKKIVINVALSGLGKLKLIMNSYFN